MANMVSVCMPVYNGMQHMGEALKSVAAQQYRTLEVIIVDDGSTDGSGEHARKLLTELGLTGSVYLIENRGAEAARDYGLERAKGEYYAPLDSDDVWENDYLAKMIGILDENPDVGLAFTNFRIFDDEEGTVSIKSDLVDDIDAVPGQRLGESILKYASSDFFSYLLNGQVVFPSCSVYRASLFKTIGPYTNAMNLDVSCDWEFALRAVRASSVIYVKEPLLNKRKHSGNVSGDAGITASSDVAILTYILSAYDLSDSERAIATNRLSKRCENVAYYNLEQGNTKLARRWFGESLKHRFTGKSLKYLLITFIPESLMNMIRGAKRKLG